MQDMKGLYVEFIDDLTDKVARLGGSSKKKVVVVETVESVGGEEEK